MSAQTSRTPEHTEFQTDDPQVAWDFLCRAYGTRLHMTGASGSLLMVRDDLGSFSIDDVDLRWPTRYAADPTPWFTVVEGRAGWAQLERDGAVDRVEPGAVVAVAAPLQESGRRGSWGPVLRERVLNLDPRALEDAARDLTGDGAEAAPRFSALRARSPAAAATWSRMVDFLCAALHSEPTALVQPLALDAMTRLLAHAALATFPNAMFEEASEPAHPPQRRDGVPAAVRRATAYIESSVDRRIGVADIAEAAHVSPRALQYAFRRHLGTTPMAYLRRARLDLAREDLLGAEMTTVAAVAGRWGFYNLGRFAREYRRAFGEGPSETLRTRELSVGSEDEIELDA